MAATSILFRKTRAQLGAVVLDASISETHTADVEVTDHPVEEGFNVSDHFRLKPEVITIEGLITNTPLPGNTVPFNPGDFEFESEAKFQADRASKAYADLRDLRASGQLVTVVTALRTYQNMKLTSLSIPRDARVGEAIKFTATLKEIRTVSSQLVAIRKPVDKGKGKTKLGPVAPNTTPEPVRKSIAVHFLEFVGAQFKSPKVAP